MNNNRAHFFLFSSTQMEADKINNQIQSWFDLLIVGRTKEKEQVGKNEDF